MLHDNLANITSSLLIHQHQPVAARLEADVFAVKFEALPVQKPVQAFTFPVHRLVVGALAFHHQVFGRRDDPRPNLVRKIFIEGIGAFHRQRFRNRGRWGRRHKASEGVGQQGARGFPPDKGGIPFTMEVTHPKSDGKLSVVSQSPSVSVA